MKMVVREFIDQVFSAWIAWKDLCRFHLDYEVKMDYELYFSQNTVLVISSCPHLPHLPNTLTWRESKIKYISKSYE